MRKNLLITTLLLLISTTMLFAGGSKFSGSLLWKISGKGLESPSYIFGTHHLAPTNFTDNVVGFNEALSASKQVYGELNMAEVEAQNQDFAFMQEIAAQMMMPKEMSYNELYTEEEYRKVDETLKTMLGVGLDQFKQMKPIGISTSLVQIIYAKVAGDVSNSEPIDLYVQKVATKEGKECFGLETYKEQLKILFDSQTIEEQAKDLLELLEDIDLAEEMMKQLNELYFAADLDGLYKLGMESEGLGSMSSDFSEKINKERNDKWLEKLPAIFADKSTFVAVGAMHLAGEDGLLYQLDKMGYTVEAVR